MTTWLVWLTLLASQTPEAEGMNAPGKIVGQVVNASRGGEPVPNAEVILQARLEGEFVPVEKTQADADGYFRFSSLPIDRDVLYLPGANREGIHYPGARVALSDRRPTRAVTIAVRDAVAEPNPLVIRRHEVVIRDEPGVRHVVEAMLLDNPGDSTYVGVAHGGPMPLTFDLGIPPDFLRLTFEEESFGREFTSIEGRVVTSMPWTPGRRWLRFTYSIPDDGHGAPWRRRVTLPCDEINVRVRNDQPDKVTANLAEPRRVADNEVEFEIARGLAAGEVLEIQLSRPPAPWTSRARWLAPVVLVALIGTAAVFHRWSARKRSQPSTNTVKTPSSTTLKGPHYAKSSRRTPRRARRG